jgi:MFS family permease
MYEHNARLYKWLNIFAYPFFWQPTLYLFLTLTKHLSATEALFLNSIYSLAVVFLEVPGGAIADHYSRKLSASLGFVIKGIGFLALTFSNNYYLLMLFMVIAAYGESLTSGSIESLLYDTVKIEKANDKRAFKLLYSKTRSILHFSMAIYMAIGGWIGKFNLTLPLQLGFIFYLIAAWISMLFIEPKQENAGKTYLDHMREGFKLIFSKEGFIKGLPALFLSDFLVLGLISAMFWLTTPLLNDIKLGVTLIGLLAASTRLIKSLGSYIVAKYDDPNDIRAMGFTLVGIIIMFFLAGLIYNTVTIILLLLGFYFIQGLYQANDIQLLNDRIGSANRTTINSIQNMFTRFYEFSIIPIVGLFIDKGQTRFSLFFIALLLVFALIILFTNRKKLSPEFYK